MVNELSSNSPFILELAKLLDSYSQGRETLDKQTFSKLDQKPSSEIERQIYKAILISLGSNN
jgi:hypothetical protein